MNFDNYYIYRIAQFIVSRLSKKKAYRLAEYIADRHFFISKKDREAVIGNLKVITSTKTDNETKQMAGEVFRNFARYIVDFLRAEEITTDYIQKHIKLEGFEKLDEALKRGKGVIATTAHLGNWELSATVTACLGYPLSIVAMVHKNHKVNKFFSAKRERVGIEVIPLGKVFKQCMQALRNNRIIALVGDRELGSGGIEVDFLGKRAIVPRGPAFFALKTGAPIIPAFIMREKKDTFRFVYESFIEPVNTGNMAEDILNLTKRYIPVIERYIKNYPEQWLMFRKFWI